MRHRCRGLAYHALTTLMALMRGLVPGRLGGTIVSEIAGCRYGLMGLSRLMLISVPILLVLSLCLCLARCLGRCLARLATAATSTAAAATAPRGTSALGTLALPFRPITRRLLRPCLVAGWRGGPGLRSAL